MDGYDLPWHSEFHFNASLQIFVLLLQNLDFLFKKHILLGLLKRQNNTKSLIFPSPDSQLAPKKHVQCMSAARESDWSQMTEINLPLSPGQQSFSLAGGFAGSLSPQLLSDSSDLCQCAGKELKPPNINMYTERYDICKDFAIILFIRDLEKMKRLARCAFPGTNFRYSQWSVHLCSSSEPPQSAWLFLLNSDFEMSAYPLDPDQAQTTMWHLFRLAWVNPIFFLNHFRMSTCRESRSFSKSSSRRVFCCSWAFLKSVHIQKHKRKNLFCAFFPNFFI